MTGFGAGVLTLYGTTPATVAQKTGKMKKILVPVDFSEHTRVTTAYAIETARHTGGGILLFHSVFDQSMLAAGVFPDAIATQAVFDVGILQEIREAAELQINSLKNEMHALSPSTPIQTLVESGPPDIEIHACAESYSPDIIVVGAVGAGQKDPFAGGTAEKLMKKTRTPVLAIPAGTHYKGLGKAMYVIDPEHDPVSGIQQAAHFFEPFGTRVHYVLICHNPQNPPDPGLVDSIRMHSEASGSFERMGCEAPAAGLQLALDKIVPDVLVFHFHRESLFTRWFRPALLRKDFYQAGLPLLAMPCNRPE